MWKLPVLTALLVLLPRSALAANADLRRALKLYDNLDYMPALDALQAADARPESTRAEKVEIQIYIGMISIALGDEAKARAAFAKVISLDRNARAPSGASPKVASILDQLRADAPAEATAPPPQPEANPSLQGQPPGQAPPPQQMPPQNPYPYAQHYYAPQPPPQPPPQAAPYSSTPESTGFVSTQTETGSSNTWSAVTGVTALVLGAAGVGLGVYFQLSANSDVTAGNGEVTAAAALNDQASANQAWTYTLVGYVAGGVLLVGGVTLLIVHYAVGPSHPAEPHAGDLSLTPGGLALSF